MHAIESAISELRRQGYSKVQTIKALVDTYGLTLDVAKDVVHKSPAWADVRERDDRFHEQILQVLQEAEGAPHDDSRTRPDQ